MRNHDNHVIEWTPERKARVVELWSGGMRGAGIACLLTAEFADEVTPNAIAGLTTRLNLHSAAEPEKVHVLNSAHPALRAGRTIFPRAVVSVPPPVHRSAQLEEGGHVLMSGKNQRKLGTVVTKGTWRGMPIFSLTLEERATCPRSCHNWRTCFGSVMPLATRFRHGRALEETLQFELGDLQHRFPRGFVVRLHLLGDFYSTEYVRCWDLWLQAFPALRVFGYTAWSRETLIGAAVHRLADEHWDRFAVRWSAPDSGPARAITLWHVPGVSPEPAPLRDRVRAALVGRSQREAARHLGISLGKLQRELRRSPNGITMPLQSDYGIIICPAQTGRTASCSTCALCWSPAARGKTIAFIGHGMRGGRK